MKNYEKIKKIIDEKFSIRLIINLLQNKHTNSKSVEYISKISENLFKKNNDNDIYLLASLLLTNTKLSAKRLVYLVDKVFNYETISYPAFQNPNIPESVIIKLAKFKGDKWLTAKTYLLNNKKLSTEILQILYDNIDANRSKKDILYDNFLFKIYTHPKVSRPLKQNIKDNYTSTSERYQKKDFLQRILKIDIEQNIDNFEDKLEDLKKIEKNNDKDKLKIFIKNITSKKLGALDRFIEALTFHGDLLDFFIKNLPLEIREYLARRIASKKDGLDKDITEKISLVLSQDPNISVLNNLLPEKYFMDDWKSEKLFENLVNRNIKKINEKLLNYDVSDFKSDYVFKNLSLSDDEEIANKAEKKLKLFKETKKRFLEMENYVKKINEEYDSSLDNIIEINKLLSNRNYANLDNFLNNLSNIEKQNALDVLTSTKKIDDVSMSSQEKIKDYILEFLSDNTLASIVEETKNIETIIAIFKKRLNQKLLNKFFSNDPILSNLSKNEKKDYYYKFYKELKKKDKDSDPIHFDELEDDDDEEIVR